ncbi:redoxin domain-containing protein [Ramlibacter lithotrophicus]|uniref:redoxin domain-containing protein n=1 Tax=Ramlibacter lithotrophicus TaxID=2606681 RepID=UPI001439F216
MRRREAIALLAAAGGLAACGDQRPRPGARWPALAVRDLGGRSATLPAASGGARLINLWALWCPPCRRELPGLDRLAAALAPRGIEVSTIAVADDAFAIREYLTQQGLGLRSVVIAPGAPGLEPLRIESLPQSFVVAADGAVLARWIGERDWDAPAVRREFDRVLQQA